jgi:hypothetical protein
MTFLRAVSTPWWKPPLKEKSPYKSTGCIAMDRFGMGREKSGTLVAP